MINMSAFIAAAEKENLGIKNIIVKQHGEIVGRWDPEEDMRRNLYSATKSFTAIAVGMAVDEGLFSLDDLVVDTFPDDLPETISENMKKMTLRHLITMSCGIEPPMLLGNENRHALRKSEPSWAKYVLRQEVVNEPGSVFLYTDAGPYLLGLLIERKSGVGLIDYLMPRLFEPLGIGRVDIELGPQGEAFGASGMMLSCDELSRFGQMLLDGGVYNGKRLVSEAYVEEIGRAHIRHDQGDEEIGTEYGYFFWVTESGKTYRCDGRFGQYCVIMKELDATITILSHNEGDKRDILRAAFRYIAPELK